MPQLFPIQVRLPLDVTAQIKAHCRSRGMRPGEFLRTLVMEACKQGLGDNQIERHLARIEHDMSFTLVALDALLAGHPDHQMRARAHAVFEKRTARRRSRDTANEGGDL